MADLNSQAQRLNDVEINNNAPVSSGTFRRVGSSINFLLDYLGISNGQTLATSAAGLNVFSSPQSVSYNYTFTEADYNINRTMFTFLGGGDRPLYFYQKSSSLSLANYPIMPNSSFENKIRFPPIFHLLYKLSDFVGESSPVSNFIVYCNGVEMGRTYNSVAPHANGGIRSSIQYTRDIFFAPAGTNTVQVKLTAFSPGSGNAGMAVIASNSFNYVAL